MDRCELCEIEISALLDGESPEEALLPVLDHLVECAHCRDFYHRARRLDEAVATLQTPLAGTPPPGLWQEIERASGLAPRRAPRRWPTRLSQIAAAVLLTFGLWAAAGEPGQGIGTAGWPSGPTGRFEVVLGQDPAGMSDARFAQIVVDVLRADRRYHHKMLEVMTAVEKLSGERESPEPIHPIFATSELDKREARERKSWTF